LNQCDAFLEQTKNKSWSKLSGYDSSGPTFSRKERYGKNEDWISSSLSARSNPDRVNEYLQSLSTELDAPLKVRHQIQPQHLGSKENPLEQYAQYVRRNKRHFVNTYELELLNRQVCEKNGHSSERNLFSDQLSLLQETSTKSSCQSTVQNKSSVVPPSPNRTKVSFSTVEVRHYERILGDNPGVSSGPPLSIGWNYYDDKTIRVSVDEYEYYQSRCQDESDMVLSRYERENILEALGYSEKEVARAIRQNYKLKRNRRQTVNNLPVIRIEEAVETAKKSLLKILPGKKRRSSKNLYKQWMKGRCENIDETASQSSAPSGVKSILKSASSQQSLDILKDEHSERNFENTLDLKDVASTARGPSHSDNLDVDEGN
jgi:hypothetical protein